MGVRSSLILYGVLGLLTGYIFLSGPGRHPVHAKALHDSGSTFEAVTGESADEDRPAWDNFYREKNYVYGKEPVSFLKDHLDEIPPGRAFVPAMGEGRNAIFLAKKGFRVDGNDLSEVALDKALSEAKAQHVTLKASVADLKTFHFPENEYDFILVCQYYDKNLVSHLKKAQKKGGMVMFYNHVLGTDPHARQASPDDFAIKPHELKEQFKDYQIKAYQEYVDHEVKVVGLLARKP